MFKILANVTNGDTGVKSSFDSLDHEDPFSTLASAKGAWSRFTNPASYHRYSNVRIVAVNDAELVAYEQMVAFNNHVCVMADTPDGYGCITCLYT